MRIRQPKYGGLNGQLSLIPYLLLVVTAIGIDLAIGTQQHQIMGDRHQQHVQLQRQRHRQLQAEERSVRFVMPPQNTNLMNGVQNLTCEIFKFNRVAPGKTMDCPDEPIHGGNRNDCFSYLEPEINITTTTTTTTITTDLDDGDNGGSLLGDGIILYSKDSSDLVNITSPGISVLNTTATPRQSLVFTFDPDLMLNQIYINITSSHYPITISVSDPTGELGTKKVFSDGSDNGATVGIISSTTPITSIIVHSFSSSEADDIEGSLTIIESICYGNESPVRKFGYDENKFSTIVRESEYNLICEKFENSESASEFGTRLTCGTEPVNSQNLGGNQCFTSLQDGFSLRSSGSNGIGTYGSAIVPGLSSAGVGAWNTGDSLIVEFDGGNTNVIATSIKVYSETNTVTVTVIDTNDITIGTYDVDTTSTGYFYFASNVAMKGLIISSNNQLHVLDELCFVLNTPPTPVCADSVGGEAFDNTCSGFVNIDNGSFDKDGHPLELQYVPEGPYDLGETRVILIVKDGMGQKTCNGRVNIVDVTPPSISCDMHLIERVPGKKLGGVFNVSYTVTDNCETEGKPSISATLDLCDGEDPTNIENGQNVTVLFGSKANASCVQKLLVTASDVFGNEDSCTVRPSLRKSSALSPSMCSVGTIWLSLVASTIGLWSIS